MASEDRASREPQPWRAGPDGLLDVEGSLGALPDPPGRPGPWSAPSPPPFAGDRLRLHVAPARRPRRGTAILAPPWKIRSRGLLDGWVRLITGRGFDAWLLVPPHHLERALPGERSGEGFVSADLGSFRRALQQTVLEVRLCSAIAAARGEVAIVGLSLGGLVAAWAATGPERVDAAALVAPPADLAAVFRGTPIGARYARLAERAGAPIPAPEELEARLRLLSPLGRSPTARRLLVAGGTRDVIALSGAEALATAWGLPLRSYARGHLTLLFACGALRRDVRDFLGSSPARR